MQSISMVWVLVLLAGALIALAIYTALYKLQVERIYPPLGKFVSVHGARIHYVERGEAKPGVAPIVLVHGASGNLRDMLQTLLPALAPDTHVIAFDRPGHGWSERTRLRDIQNPAAQAYVLREALLALGVEKPVLLGHSWGGAVASAYAVAYGDELSGLLVLSGATHAWPGGVAWYHSVVNTPFWGELFLRTLVVPVGQRMLKPGAANNFKPNHVPTDYTDKIGLGLLLRANEFRDNSKDSLHLKDYLAKQSAHYSKIKVPTIIITGNADYTVSPKIHSYALHNAIEGSELIKLRGVGHMPHYASTSIVVDALMRLARGEKPRPAQIVIEREL